MLVLLGDQLRSAIRRSELTDSDIARQTNVNQSQIQRFRSGKDIRLRTAEKLALFFQLQLAKDAHTDLDEIKELLERLVQHKQAESGQPRHPR